MRLLVVEDSRVQQELLSRLFATDWFRSVHIDFAETLAEADTKLRGINFIVLDLTLPGSGPTETLKWLAQVKVPGIVVSADTSPSIIKRAVAAGAIGFLRKGNLAEQIIDAIEFASEREAHVTEQLDQRRCCVQATMNKVQHLVAEMAGSKVEAY